MYWLLLADSTFEFSVGAVLGLVTMAIGLGVIRSQVGQNKTDIRNAEQLRREDIKDIDARFRDLERWQDRTKGRAEHARDNRRASDSGETQTFSRGDKS